MHRDDTTALDLAQLRDMTLDDEGLMREILAALIDDTARQMVRLDQAIREKDSQATRQLAHYSRGVCANVGANAAAAALETIESTAEARDFEACRSSLDTLALELQRLRANTQLAL